MEFLDFVLVGEIVFIYCILGLVTLRFRVWRLMTSMDLYWSKEPFGVYYRRAVKHPIRVIVLWPLCWVGGIAAAVILIVVYLGTLSKNKCKQLWKFSIDQGRQL